VNNLSSVVGVDAANNTMLHTGSMLINLKHNAAAASRQTMDRLRQPVWPDSGLTLYLQPTQDLTIDAETGPTQFRVSIEGADNATVNEWATKLAEQMRTKAEGAQRGVGRRRQRQCGLRQRGPRQASRLSITAASIDDALYSAFGQRIVSTIFTETNQYRVILKRSATTSPRRPTWATCNPHRLRQGHAAVGRGHHQRTRGAAAGHARGAVSGHHAGLRHRAGVSLGTAVDSIRRPRRKSSFRPSVTLTFLGASGAIRTRCRTSYG
jgi:multidrug efflux pump